MCVFIYIYECEKIKIINTGQFCFNHTDIGVYKLLEEVN